MTESIFVFLELQGGTPRKSSLQALGAARSIADTWDIPVEVLVAGEGDSETFQRIIHSGADKVWLLDDAALETYQVETHVNALGIFLENKKEFLILCANTAMSKDFGPRLAQRLKAGYVADVSAINIVEDQKPQFTRPIYAGKALSNVTCCTPSIIAILRSNAFVPSAPDESRTGEVASLPVGNDLREPIAKLREIVQRDGGTIDLAEAEIIVSGGYGVEGPEGFEFLRPLAEALGAAQGASRAAVNAGWIDHQHQVGQTGKTVSPALYIACGISGQIQHLAGMSSAKCIVAINTDPEAPIFQRANYGIVGDLFKVVSVLIEEIKHLKSVR